MEHDIVVFNGKGGLLAGPYNVHEGGRTLVCTLEEAREWRSRNPESDGWNAVAIWGYETEDEVRL